MLYWQCNCRSSLRLLNFLIILTLKLVSHLNLKWKGFCFTIKIKNQSDGLGLYCPQKSFEKGSHYPWNFSGNRLCYVSCKFHFSSIDWFSWYAALAICNLSICCNYDTLYNWFVMVQTKTVRHNLMSNFCFSELC